MSEGHRMTHDVTVRIPVQFESAAEAAGFIERAVSNALKDAGYSGSAFVIWREQPSGQMWCFLDGEGGAEYEGVPPHGTEFDIVGHRVEDGGVMGTIVTCEECSGSGVLHDPHERPPVSEPTGADRG